MLTHIRRFFLLPLVVVIFSCNQQSTDAKSTSADSIPQAGSVTGDPSIPGNFSDQSALKFDSSQLASFLQKHARFGPMSQDLSKFYRDRNFSYAWFDQGGLVESSYDLFNRIQNITEEGIPADIPYLDEYKGMMEGEDSSASSGSMLSPDLELMITAQYFNYARKVWTGLSPNQTEELGWYVPRKKLAYDKLLDSMLADVKSGRDLKAPVHKQYFLLKKYLEKFRSFEREGSWITIKAERKKYEMGDSAPEIASIRKKLFQAGDLASDNGSALFDPDLEQGVKSYQQRYGLKEDGIAGPSLIREMNAPLEARIRQIIVNMERARWVNDDPKGRYTWSLIFRSSSSWLMRMTAWSGIARL
jgi:murein L,D-transpeptidase YcbB/YkuD